jgi:hypothetical protein
MLDGVKFSRSSITCASSSSRSHDRLLFFDGGEEFDMSAWHSKSSNMEICGIFGAVVNWR